MSAPAPPSPTANAPGTSGSAQAVLGIFLAVLLGLLAYRGYGSHFGARPTEPAVAAPVDLNAAGEAELVQVPGIGSKTAQSIVLHRQTHGPFRSVEELRNVRGIGAQTLEKVRHRFHTETIATDPLAPPEPPATITRTSFSSPLTSDPPPLPPRPVASTGAKKLQPGDPPIDVNTASPDELQRLPGVGPVMAHAIVTARATKPFDSVNDLDRVKGIGAKTLDKLRPFVTVR
ncbi:ComE operon protein 1 [Gemmata obscuriglobus]|uniref:ComEA family DNA-binding protein n=1 Tax=Gemmata obscuriglobus TaxID=114 RepID=UPI00016C59E5|nr:helix-hairpin-helix domain-containing protein [Gemmata obscuriglobus]QEG27176.1 ComE operon protein 1 [Gemmata obscuriglobus]VTS03826.1 competence protein : Competence protein ComEA-like protein with helix-hairpin-helix repeat region OS=Fervidobacterium pennivorans (strain DSM 9078 / Ven5) GN=Ferpe_1934 PE=4 SV=1: HHH_3: HHH_3 [Gemmata obscuriglobus UQM 2246]